MKKFLSVLVALTLCACLLAPVSFAADSFAELAELLEENGISADALDLDSVDVDALLDELKNDSAALEDLRALANAGTIDEDEDTADDGAAATGIDLSFLTGLFAGDTDITALSDALANLSTGDFTSLLGTVSGVFSGAGVDLASLDLGADVATLLGGDDLAQTATNLTAGVMDTIKGALESLGLDSSIIEGLLDNEIVNFFANMYIGFIGEVEESTTEPTTKPPVVTTKPPKTGDTSAVFVAIGALAVAAAVAAVCLKKKKED